MIPRVCWYWVNTFDAENVSWLEEMIHPASLGYGEK